ncbi:alpha/beta-hydrolase [Auriscalpium vulgare]|uniref:Alpha/beta-hydrolase n=1 Tax=Auriscalpium vulgare TaxID=40419 RepID=A0ACB8RUF6_9AGAM|nr:alpha/beta-hydrolase [Auriscalpium vulgare]
MLFSAALVSLVPLLAAAAPLVDRADNTAATTTVSDTDDFVRPAQFARIAYCSSEAVQSWNCGDPCKALGLGSVQPLAVGGDGGATPRFFVAHDNTTNSVVVAHQGTDADNPLSVINDLKFLKSPINSTLFPNAGDDVEVHRGFAEAQGRTADTVLSTVKDALTTFNTNKILVTGHSLGAAIATMDALMLRQNLDPSTAITTTVFGLPRGGNQAYADMVDSQLGSDYTFITHKNDPVPVVPPRVLGFQHSAGEVHITATDDSTGEATNTVACPGQENANCQDGNSLLSTSVADHLGPYFADVSMSRSNCPL